MATTFKQGNVSFKMFFDRAKVLEQLSKKEERVLNRTGGEGRQTIKRSMRPGGKAGKASMPGEPPRWQTKKLRDAIFYGYDGSTRSVVIGPIKSQSASKQNVPLLLEQGGQVQNALVRVAEDRPRKKKKQKYRYIRQDITIAPRPYVGPTSVNHPKILAQLKTNIERYKLL